MLQSPDPLLPLSAARSPWLRGTLGVPGDAAAAQLALLLAGLARGESAIGNVPDDAGVDAMARVLVQLGVAAAPVNGRWHVDGLGLGALLQAEAPVDLSELGEAAGLVFALVAASDMETTFTAVPGTPWLAALLQFLHRNGVAVAVAGDRVTVRGPRFSLPLDVALSAEAAPLIGPLLVHALASSGRSVLHLPAGHGDPAQHLIASFGGTFATDPDRLSLEGLGPLGARALDVPGDAALAALPLAAALVAADSEITVANVALSARARAMLTALQLFGADLSVEGSEGLAQITARHGPLRAATIPASLLLPTEDYSVLAAIAAFAPGESRLEGFGGGIRRMALTRALRANGIECAEEEAGALVVRGTGRVPGGGMVVTRLDPKLAMAFLVLGLGAEQPVSIDDGGVMQSTFADFVPGLEHLGAKFMGPMAS